MEWLPENGGCFTVKSTYLLLRSLCQPHLSKSPLKLYVYRNLWKSWAPMKVSTLSWQLLLDRLPMKFNLHRRGIIPQVDSKVCVCARVRVYCVGTRLNRLYIFSCIVILYPLFGMKCSIGLLWFKIFPQVR